MAERRMFSKAIVSSDAFLDMPQSSRNLYFALGMEADDDGFVGSPKSVMRQVGASQDDMSVLIAKRYILGFQSGVICIKHWRINNLLRSDRYKPTTYVEELSTLMLDEKSSYTERKEPLKELGIPMVNQSDTDGRRSVDSRLPQYSLGKYSILKGSNSACTREDTHTLEVIALLFPKLRKDTVATLSVEEYKELAKAMRASGFAQQTIKTLSQLEKHKDALLAGEWEDFSRSSKSTDYMSANYGARDIDNTFTDLKSINPDEVDI